MLDLETPQHFAAFFHIEKQIDSKLANQLRSILDLTLASCKPIGIL